MTQQQPDNPTLVGTRWRLTTLLHDGTASSVPPGVTAGITITSGALRVQTGCNTGGAPVTTTGTSMTIGEMFLTGMGCTANLTNVEGEMTAVLSGTVDYRIVGDQLTITKPGGDALVFLAQGAAPVPSAEAGQPGASAQAPATTHTSTPATPGPVAPPASLPPVGPRTGLPHPPLISIPPQPPSN